MDLSKAFDTVNHNLLIAKLQAYGFSMKALKLIKSYLSNRWQRTKVNNSLGRGQNYYTECLKGQFWDSCCSTFFLMIFYSFLWIPVYVILLMTLRYMPAIFPQMI